MHLVRTILTNPDIYDSIGDDYTPPAGEFQVNLHPEIVYLAARSPRGLFGMFTLLPRNRVCWELHVVMLPRANTKEKWQAARELPGWLAQHTECRRLVGEVPACNWPAVVYGTHGIGMQYVGRHPSAFMKGGKLQDLIILGLSIGS